MAGAYSNEIILSERDGTELPIVPRLIDFGPPPGGIVEIAQNVRTLLRTAIWTVPLDRAFGIDFSFLDLPMPVAQMQIQAEVWQKINYYEPRVTAEDVAFAGDALTGYLQPTLKLAFQPQAAVGARYQPLLGESSSAQPAAESGPRLKFNLLPLLPT